MSSQKTDDKAKARKTPGKEELSSGDLDKVVGGLKKNIGGATAPKPVGFSGDPCEGGQ